jgi:hypothetical protein
VVSKRSRRSSSASTRRSGCARVAGLTREALSKAVGKPHVQQFMQRRIQESCALGRCVQGRAWSRDPPLPRR